MSRHTFRHPLTIAAAVVIMTMLLPAVGSAEQRPFHASLSGNASLTPTPDPCVLRNDETAAGEATHLGRFEWASTEFANFCTVPGGVSVSGSFTMTAANGDGLFGEYATTGLFDAAGNLVIHGTFSLTGGSGRFADTTGGGIIDAIGYLTPGLPVTGTMLGTIDY